MDSNQDPVAFKTIKVVSTGLFKDRGSKFFGYAFPFTSKEDLKNIIDDLKKEHRSARHFCYAYRINPKNPEERANDDGEPGHSAGTPILGQIQSTNGFNILVVVVRYFGGTKLGVPGLINAYKSAAKEALQSAHFITQEIEGQLRFTFEYAEMNDVMRVIKQVNPRILEQNMHLRVEMLVSIREDKLVPLRNALSFVKSLTFTEL